MAEGEENKSSRIPKGKIDRPEQSHVLSAEKVKNKVLWINPKMRKHLPFKLELDKPCDLGLFLTGSGETQDTYPLEMMPHHNRSALVIRAIFKDANGRLWRDVNIKGQGASRYDEESGKYVLGSSDDDLERYKGMRGLLAKKDGEYDRDKSEFFLKHGLRTHRVIALIELEEIIGPNWKKMSIEEAIAFGLIPAGSQPILELRAFVTQARVQNANDPRLLGDAMHLVAQELGKDPEKFDQKEYLRWFASTLGEQIAILHNLNHYHEYISAHNLTLDCRITDLDSVGKLSANKDDARRFTMKDIQDAASTLDWLFIRLQKHEVPDSLISSHPAWQEWEKLSDEISKTFCESYARHVTNPRILREWLIADYLKLREITLPETWNQKA